MAVVVPVASPLEPIVIGLASFVAGTLFSQLPADLPAATAKFAQLVEEPSRIAGAAATYHLAQFAPNWHVYATTGAFVLLLLVFMADFYIYRGHFRTVSDVMSLVTLGVVIKQQMDYITPGFRAFASPNALDFAANPTSKLFADQVEGFVEGATSMAIGHLGQLGCLAAFLLLRIYGLLGGKFFINKEINRREETAARARGDWVPRNEIERLQEELRREVMQGDSVAIRPVVDGKVLTEEDILAGKAGTKAQGDARAVVERRKRKEADAAAEAKKDE